MKNSKHLFLMTAGGLIIIVACVVFLTTQKISLERKNHAISQALINCEDRRQLAESKNIILESNVILAKRSTGKIIDGKISLTDIYGKKHTVVDISVKNTPVLIFRYSNVGGCSPCINTTFEHLGRLKESIGSNKLRIIVIPNNMDLRQMIVEGVHPLKNQFVFYLADENGLGLPVDEMLVSYLTIVDGNKTNNVFVIDNMFLPLLKKYIDTLIENYK